MKLNLYKSTVNVVYTDKDGVLHNTFLHHTFTKKPKKSEMVEKANEELEKSGIDNISAINALMFEEIHADIPDAHILNLMKEEVK